MRERRELTLGIHIIVVDDLGTFGGEFGDCLLSLIRGGGLLELDDYYSKVVSLQLVEIDYDIIGSCLSGESGLGKAWQIKFEMTQAEIEL